MRLLLHCFRLRGPPLSGRMKQQDPKVDKSVNDYREDQTAAPDVQNGHRQTEDPGSQNAFHSLVEMSYSEYHRGNYNSSNQRQAEEEILKVEE